MSELLLFLFPICFARRESLMYPSKHQFFYLLTLALWKILCPFHPHQRQNHLKTLGLGGNTIKVAFVNEKSMCIVLQEDRDKKSQIQPGLFFVPTIQTVQYRSPATGTVHSVYTV